VEPAQPGDRRPGLRDDPGARRTLRPRPGSRSHAWWRPPLRQALSRTRKHDRRLALRPAARAALAARPGGDRPGTVRPRSRRRHARVDDRTRPVHPSRPPRPPRVRSVAALGLRGVPSSYAPAMAGVPGRRSPERTAVAALAAGCDMLLACQSLETAIQAMRGVERAVERDALDGRQVAQSL